MTKIALIQGDDVLKCWTVGEGTTELAIRYDLPSGEQVSPVAVGWTDGEFAVKAVVEFTVPEGKVITGPASYSVENGEVVETYPVSDPVAYVPDRVTARQFKLQLLAIGQYDEVQAWVAQQSQAMQIAFEYSGTFLRTEPMMQAGFSAMGFTEEMVDAFFVAAGQL